MPEYNAPGGGDSSPLTTKGDVYTYDTGNARLAVGTNGHVLTADSSTATGLKWAAASGSGNTLDGAYDQGGAGAGRSISADNGAVQIETSAANAALEAVTSVVDQSAIVVNANATNTTSPALQVATTNLSANTTPVVKVLAGTGGSGTEVFIANNDGIVATGSTGTPQIRSVSDDNAVAAEVQLTSNSRNSTIGSAPDGALTITGNASATLTSAAASVVSTGGNVALSATGGVVHVNGGTGFCSGDVPTTINTHSASIGTTHVASMERSLVVGQANAAQDDSLAVGESCTALVNSMALGNQASSTHYSGGHVLVMAAANDAGGPSANTLVLDAGNAIPAHPTAAIAPPVSPSGVGNVYLDAGGVYSGGADYAEMFEWNDGNANSADRRGLFVSLVNGNKLSVGGSNVIGVVSSSPVVIGDAAELSWHGKYERDEFGGIVYQTIDGMRRPKPSTSYIPTQTYTPRRMRKEWAPIGLVGKLHVRSAQALTAGNKCSANSSGYAVSGNDYHILRVIRQPTSTLYGIIEILMK